MPSLEARGSRRCQRTTACNQCVKRSTRSIHSGLAIQHAAAQASATTSKSHRPLFHKFSECRFHIHGTPRGFGQSASKCITPPQAKPNNAVVYGLA